MSKFYSLSEDTIEDFNAVYDKKSFPVNLKFQFIGSNKQKKLIQISKLADDMMFILEKELKVTINEDLMNVFDEESRQILIEQELDKIVINLDSGAIKLVKPDLTTFSGLIKKYGIEKVSKANMVEELYDQQKKDGTTPEEEPFEFDSTN